MIDKEGFRHGIGIILVNAKRQVLLAKRIGRPAWQFPQGGVKKDETPEQAMFRELYEELGLQIDDVKVLSSTHRWLRYRLPKQLVRYHSKPICIGQKQKWFLLQLTASDAQINLAATGSPEFDSWAWVSYWYPLTQVVAFKRRVYSMAMKEFSRIVLSKRFWEQIKK
ncbi:MAG: rppH 1 [Gammaproteobacteria bacterium]|nr:rppH 1 [Gammaproteobacteria bacterium]MCE3237948.1 rppH 1 [Gammaproteobacteria bacterium]